MNQHAYCVTGRLVQKLLLGHTDRKTRTHAPTHARTQAHWDWRLYVDH